MKLKELFEDDEHGDDSVALPTGKVERAPKQKDKTKHISRMLRRKADRNNPEKGDEIGPKWSADQQCGDDPDNSRLGAGLQ